MKKSLLLMLVISFSFSLSAKDIDYSEFSLDNINYRMVKTNPKNINLHWKNDSGNGFGNFSSLKSYLEKQQKKILMLVNAGIYTKKYNPAGLHIEKGKELSPLNTKRGKGNFHIQPNGVFLIYKNNKARILTTKSYKRFVGKKYKNIRLATQSGPMLLIDGKINYVFKKDGKSKYHRNGVCTLGNNEVVFFATDGAKVNLYQFAKSAKYIGCKNALYLDGNISKMYLPDANFIFHFARFVAMFSITTN